MDFLKTCDILKCFKCFVLKKLIHLLALVKCSVIYHQSMSFADPSSFSIIIISHNLHQVFSLADHIYVMRSGEVVASVDTLDSSVSQLQELILSQEENCV